MPVVSLEKLGDILNCGELRAEVGYEVTVGDGLLSLRWEGTVRPLISCREVPYQERLEELQRRIEAVQEGLRQFKQHPRAIRSAPLIHQVEQAMGMELVILRRYREFPQTRTLIELRFGRGRGDALICFDISDHDLRLIRMWIELPEEETAVAPDAETRPLSAEQLRSLRDQAEAQPRPQENQGKPAGKEEKGSPAPTRKHSDKGDVADLGRKGHES